MESYEKNNLKVYNEGGYAYKSAEGLNVGVDVEKPASSELERNLFDKIKNKVLNKKKETIFDAQKGVANKSNE